MTDPAPPFRIAVITTEYRTYAHADVIVSRWLKPLETDAHYGWFQPRTQIASMYVSQQPEGRDLSVAKSEEFGVPLFATVEEALTLGGDELAVDAVLLIAEHGEYPENEFRQKLYPRKELFDEVVAVMRKSGRVVPMFFDKHLSWKPEFIEQMTADLRREGIPFLGGSSCPFSPLVPEAYLPDGTEFSEVVAVYFNGLEAYLFHSMELVQAMIERRPGGETGVKKIVAWEDEEVWLALDRGEFSAELLEAACASAGGGQSMADFRAARGTPVAAFQLHYHDGLKVTHVNQQDSVKKFCLAWQLASGEKPGAAYSHTVGEDHFYAHFARLNAVVEKFFLSQVSPLPLERLYFTSMATALAMQALHQPGQPLLTPALSRSAIDGE